MELNHIHWVIHSKNATKLNIPETPIILLSSLLHEFQFLKQNDHIMLKELRKYLILPCDSIYGRDFMFN